MSVIHSLSARLLLAAALFLALAGQASAQPYIPDRTYDDERMKWFADAKLGIFIHWGIYAVNGLTSRGHSTTNSSAMMIT